MIYYFCIQNHFNELQLEHTDGTFVRRRPDVYGISLVELERHSHVSNQYLSALELGNVSRTANNEEVLGCAIDEIIRSRKSSLFGLEQMIRQYRGHLLETVEVEKGEL